MRHNYRYVGITSNLEDRLSRHNDGRSHATRSFAPFRLIHKENYSNMLEARKREKFLKSGFGRKFLDNLES